MFRCLASQALRLASRQVPKQTGSFFELQNPIGTLKPCNQARFICLDKSPGLLSNLAPCDKSLFQPINPSRPVPSRSVQPLREFVTKGSKVEYLDFRYKRNTCHLRSHLLIIRRQKMKKHRRRKWRKKFKSLLAKQRLKREIAKEKTFRVELLTMIKRAEEFDPKEYALSKINEINNRPKELTETEKREQLKELIRVHRYQVTFIKPKHKRFETYGLEL